MVLKMEKLVQEMRRKDINIQDQEEVEVDPGGDLTVEETDIHPDHTEEDPGATVEIDIVGEDLDQEKDTAEEDTPDPEQDLGLEREELERLRRDMRE